MKIKQILEGNNTTSIVIGYDDHVSVYDVPEKILNKLATMTNLDDINDFIINNGKAKDVTEREAQNHSGIFLDMTNPSDIDEFRKQIKDYIQ